MKNIKIALPVALVIVILGFLFISGNSGAVEAQNNLPVGRYQIQSGQSTAKNGAPVPVIIKIDTISGQSWWWNSVDNKWIVINN